MSLLFIDGFDHYATADMLKKWSNLGGLPWTINATAGRRGGGAAVAYSGNYPLEKNLAASESTVIVGFANYSLTSLATAAFLLALKDAGTFQTYIYCNADGSLSAFRYSSTLLGTSAPGVILPNTWQYIEIKITISDTVGVVVVKVNGTTVMNLSGQDTKNTANAYCTTVCIGNPSTATSPAGYTDDLYICNTAGSTNNNFLGDVRVDTLYPTSDGNYSQFTCSTGSSHFALVDEATPNTTDYNDGATVDDRDSYGLGNLAALISQTVYGVQVNAAVLKDDAGAKSAATFVRSSSTNGDGASAGLSTSQVYVSQVFETDPNGSIPWTETTVNAMEAGVKVTA